MNIERFLREQTQEQKRTGRGIFSRVSTRKGGGNQALRTPYLYMSNKEKKQLNGGIKVVNVFEQVVSKKELMGLDKGMQRKALLSWRDRFTSKQIIKESGMTKQTYYGLLSELDIEVKTRFNSSEQESKLLTMEELENAKNDFISYKEFLALSPKQRGTVILEYLKHTKGTELAKFWGVTSNLIYNHKYQANQVIKFSQTQEETSQEAAVMIENGTLENTQQNEETVTTIVSSPKTQVQTPVVEETVVNIELPEEIKSEFFQLSLNKTGQSKDIAKQLRSVLAMVESMFEDSESNITLKLSLEEK